MFHRTRVLALLCLAAPTIAAAQAQPIAFEDASAAIPFLSVSVQSGGTGVVGTLWFDYDGDGRDDLLLPNGAGRRNAFYRNEGDGTFTDHAAAAGVAESPGTGGGIAADLGQPVLLRNTGGDNNWLKLRAVGTVSNRDGVGARVTVRAGDLAQLQEIYAGSSLASQHSLTLTFGLGARTQATADVTWPSGFRNRLYDLHAGTTTALPEIPCSFDDPAVEFPEYQQCVVNALDRLRQAGIVASELSGRVLSSALRAHNETH